MLEYIFNFLTSVSIIFVGWLVRKILYLEGEIMKLRAQAIPRQELSDFINLKQESVKVLQQEQKEDIQRLEEKLDRILELLAKTQ